MRGLAALRRVEAAAMSLHRLRQRVALNFYHQVERTVANDQCMKDEWEALRAILCM